MGPMAKHSVKFTLDDAPIFQKVQNPIYVRSSLPVMPKDWSLKGPKGAPKSKMIETYGFAETGFLGQTIKQTDANA